MGKLKFYILFLLLTATTAFGQQQKVETSIDSTKIRIGSQFHLTLKTTVDTNSLVNFPEGKNFGQLEVLESFPIDTVKNGALYELVKKYGLTQFDSGRYVIPRLPVVINDKNFQSDSLIIEVANIEVDTLKQKLYDIKPVMEAESNTMPWYLIPLGVLIGLVLGFAILEYKKRRKAKKAQPKGEEVHYASPIEKATTQLRELESKALLEKGAVKDYYSELTDIARMYIEEAIHIPAMESTTAELIDAMRIAVRRKKMNLSQETFEQLEKVLRNADMVKFAKSKPLDFEIAEDRSRIEKSIVVIDQSIPEEKDEDEEHTLKWLEMQRKAKEKKRKRIIIGASIAGVVVILITLMFTVGMGYLKDNVIGHPTKELLQGEWVKSQYGNPPVVIETPRVLMRQDKEKHMPEGAHALIKDMQLFAYGSLLDNFSINVYTISYKEKAQLDLSKVFDATSQMWESQGAENILVKQEDFTTESGAKGLRAYGTMSLPNPVTKEKKTAYYEVLFFTQQGGLQQVAVIHEDNDEAAKQITERIQKSIEFGQVNKAN